MEYRKYKTIPWEEFFKSEEEKELEKQAAIINRNKKLRKIFVTSIGITLFVSETVLAGANPFQPIGIKFWNYIRYFAKYACLIMAGIEIIKSLGAGDAKSVTKIILKYLIAYAAFAILPWLFGEIDETLSNL